MKRIRVVASVLTLSLLSGLLGCDVAVVALLASKNGGGSKNSAPPAPDVSFRLWVAELGAVTGAAEQATLIAANGDPDGKWTQLDSPTTSGDYTMPAPTAGGFDAILIQATENQVYEIDAIEILDATGTTIQTAAGATTFCSPDILAPELLKAQGPPNGVGTLTAATPTARSFLFMKRASPITRFRINLWRLAAPRISGDVEWASTLARGSDQRAGGAATNSQGKTYVAFRDPTAIFMIRYNNDGSQDGTLATLESTIPTVGSASIAINPVNDDVFVAATYDDVGPNTNIHLSKYVGSSNSPATPPVNSIGNAGPEYVEANSLTMDSDGNLIVAGAADFGGLNGVGHYLRKHNTTSSFDNVWSLTTPPAAPLDTTTNPRPTYWYCVATDRDNSGNRLIYTSGDLSALAGIGNEDAYTAKTIDNAITGNPTGPVTELWNSKHPNGAGRPARGQAIGVDGNHNVYLAGFTTGTGLDSFIFTYDGAAAPTPPAVSFFEPARTGNDEFLDIAVESDGTVYATGYETNGAQGEDLVLYKIAANKAILWKRTVNQANLADRGVKVILTPTHVIVSGEVGVAAGNIDIHVRKYVK